MKQSLKPLHTLYPFSIINDLCVPIDYHTRIVPNFILCEAIEPKLKTFTIGNIHFGKYGTTMSERQRTEIEAEAEADKESVSIICISNMM